MPSQPKSLYEKILQAEKSSTVQEIVDRENSKQIRVHMPCKVVEVHGATVDVEIQGGEDSGFGYYVKFPLLLDLPIIYNNYTSSAYIITPIQKGDTGLVEFLDFNASEFSSNGASVISSDQYPHSLNNGTFINGFIPSNNQLDIPRDKPIVIGLHNKTFTLSVDNSGNLNIKAKDITISGSNVNITGSNIKLGSKTTIDGKSFLAHKHSNGNQGNPTGGVI